MVVPQASKKVSWFLLLDESLIITGELLWRDEKCYKYELDQLENCKNKLILNNTYVTCNDEEQDSEEDYYYEDYELFNTFDNQHRQAAKPPPVKVDKERICKVLKLGNSCN